MNKLVLLALVVVLGCKLVFGRWPWQLWTSSARDQAQGRARALLGVPKGASRQDIIEAHRRLVAVVHPDRGGTHDAVLEANAARDLLLEGIQASMTDKT